MNATFDTLFDQVSSGNIPQPEQKTSSFDELFDQVKKPERTPIEKAGRLGAQVGLGFAEAHPLGLAYELGVALPASSQAGQSFASRARMGQDLEFLYENNAGKPLDQWSQKDQELYNYISEQIKPGGELKDQVEAPQIGIHSLASKATGIDLHPEGWAEKSALWLSYLKDPKKGYAALKDAFKNPQEGLKLIKEVIPGTKALRAATAGAGLQMAEDGQLGPIGTIAAAIAGDLIGHTPKGIYKVVTNPKEYLAKGVNLVTRGNSSKSWINDLVETANKEGIQLDAGTLTNSNLVKMAQARASQSALSGNSLDNFRKSLSEQIINRYKTLADEVGEMAFENEFQASEAIKNTLKDSETNLNAVPKESNEKAAARSRPLQDRIDVQIAPEFEQELLQRISPEEIESTSQAGQNLKTAANDIKAPIKQEIDQAWTQFENETAQIETGPQAQLVNDLQEFIHDHQGSLLPDVSAAERGVMQAAQELLARLSAEGGLIGVSLRDLIKTKRSLADVANYEFGGSNFESAYKKIVGDIDAAIQRTMQRSSPELLETFQELNAEYSAYKDVFENKNVLKLFEPKNENYNSIFNSFVNDADKLRSLEDMFYNNPRGQQLINQVKREHARRALAKPDFSNLDMRNLIETLGPEFRNEIQEYATARQHAIDHPLPRPTPQRRLGIENEAPQVSGNTSNTPLKGRVKESISHQRKKLLESIGNKSPQQIMKMMDTVEGIRKLKNTLSLTPEGKKLFKDLSRYKLEEIIGNKMKSDIKEQVKLGTFSNLLKTSKNKAIIKELIGQESYNSIRNLQKLSSALEDSLMKFYNASKSGTTVTDVALISSGVMGLISGNPFIALSALGTGLGMRIGATLLSDPKFLKLLEKAVISKSEKTFLEILKRMEPSIKEAVLSNQVMTEK